MPQEKYWAVCTDDWQIASLVSWGHIEQVELPCYRSKRFSPEAPRANSHKGYAVMCVGIQRAHLRFSLREQLVECIRVLSLSPLPAIRRLSELRSTAKVPDGHWPSRLPASLGSPNQRMLLVQALKEAQKGAFI